MDQSKYKFSKVMVVDDAHIDRFLASKIISKYSFAKEVVEAVSAMQALDYLKEAPESSEGLPDIIFLDINMPEMSGFDFLEEYEKLSEHMKSRCIIIMLSSSLHPEDKELALKNPYVCRFLNKPLNEQKLQELIVNGRLACNE